MSDCPTCADHFCAATDEEVEDLYRRLDAARAEALEEAAGAVERMAACNTGREFHDACIKDELARAARDIRALAKGPAPVDAEHRCVESACELPLVLGLTRCREHLIEAIRRDEWRRVIQMLRGAMQNYAATRVEREGPGGAHLPAPSDDTRKDRP